MYQKLYLGREKWLYGCLHYSYMLLVCQLIQGRLVQWNESYGSHIG